MREIAAMLLAVRGRIERGFDAPVVGHIEDAPGGVVEIGPLGLGLIPQTEAPARIEGHDITRAGRQPVSREGCGSKTKQATELKGAQKCCT